MDRKSLDHFAIAVYDLDAAGTTYERLGFRVLPRMRHIDIRSSNRVMQFEGTYLELIGDIDQSISDLRRRVLPRFECGEGLVFTSITASDLELERRRLAGLRWKGDPIISARRKITMPDGREDETDSRCIYVWRDERPYSMLFFSEHRKPSTIWVPEYQRHRNTARRVTAISYISNDPRDDGRYAADLLGYAPIEAGGDRVAFHTPRGETLEYLSPDAASAKFGAAAPDDCATQPCLGVALRIEVADIDACGRTLRESGITITKMDGVLRVPAVAAHGTVLDFHAAP